MITKKQSTILVVLASFFVFLGLGVLVANEMPDFVKIDQDVYKTNRRGPVSFEHERHVFDYEIACKKCHHDYEDGENVWEEGDSVNKCVSCHDPLKNEGDIKSLRLAFHKNCKGCHRDLQRQGLSDTAPSTKCRGCHEK